ARCDGGGGDGQRLVCTACRTVCYCSLTCQKADWKRQKGQCKRACEGLWVSEG
ncbi:unnamed protein product, partial [Phaeothamnion confervicola]